MKVRELLPGFRRGALAPLDERFPESFFRHDWDRLFDEFFGNGWGRVAKTGFMPDVDVSETDTAVTVEAELPGMTEKDIEVVLGENHLFLRGEKHEEKKTSEEGVRRVERSFGKFERSIPLGVEVNTEKVTAEYKDGVLRITLPKTEKAKAAQKKIEVKHG